MVQRLIIDTHVHTSFSVDSNEPMEEYFKKASDNGIKYLITTDHYDFEVANKKDNNWTFDISEQRKVALTLSKKYPNITFLKGIELGYKKEFLKELNQIATNHTFDQIILSIHEDGVYDYYQQDVFKTYGIKVVLDNYFKQMEDALNNFDHAQILGHIDYALKTVYLYTLVDYTDQYEDEIRKILRLVKGKNMALEVNTKVQDLMNEGHLEKILKMYKEEGGILLSLASDAHSKIRYFASFDKYLKIIKNSGFDKIVYYINQTPQFYEIK